MEIQVLKANGELEPFKAEKLRASLRKAGATKEEIQDITAHIEGELFDGIKTEDIYQKAFEILRTSERPKAARYSLRRALFNLGPTGFPFEDFVAQLFAAEGYDTKVRTQLYGRCAVHEIDVTAYNEKECTLVEVKFHGRPGVKTDLKDALYSYARFLDLRDVKVDQTNECGIGNALIVTNTKFTSVAVQYAACVGLDLLSWNYPQENTLQQRVERAGIFPITALSSLSQSNKRELVKQGHILCQEVIDNNDILRSVNISEEDVRAAVDESERLCKLAV